jgi:hypothetical protein
MSKGAVVRKVNHVVTFRGGSGDASSFALNVKSSEVVRENCTRRQEQDGTHGK